MDLASKIREIQNSNSQDKFRDLKDVFDEIISQFPNNTSLLQTVYKSVCDNINSAKTIVPIELPTVISSAQANKFTYKNLNIFIVDGNSGTTYLSWEQKFMEDNMIKSITDRIKESGASNFIEEVKEIQQEFPYFEIQFLISLSKLKAYEIALHAQKNIAYIIDGIYILYK